MVEFCPGKWNIWGTAVLLRHVTWAGVSCSLPVFWLLVLSLPSLLSASLYDCVSAWALHQGLEDFFCGGPDCQSSGLVGHTQSLLQILSAVIG